MASENNPTPRVVPLAKDGSRFNKALVQLSMLMPHLPQSGWLDDVIVIDGAWEVWERVLDGESTKPTQTEVEKIAT